MGQTSSKITSHDRAIFQLKQQRDKIRQYQKRLDLLIDHQNTLAKQCLPHDPAKAKFYLRCKRRQVETREKTYGQLETLETLIGTIEDKMVESDVMKSLSQGNTILKQLNKEMNVDKIDKIMDDLYEERVKVDEVSEMLGSGLVSDTEVDEEFERMLKETQPEAKLPEAPSKMPEVPVKMPDVPVDVPEIEEGVREKPAKEESALLA